ncbi:hypothetical protein U0070_001596 [Myodes glareolus]|uniref:Uncharacterized protein n=1 Tax=Myodes glareolus TaxID=447135 RepID=A0AAW0IWW6_MYOGA
MPQVHNHTLAPNLDPLVGKVPGLVSWDRPRHRSSDERREANLADFSRKVALHGMSEILFLFQ